MYIFSCNSVAKLKSEPTTDILKTTMTKLTEEWQKMDDCILNTSVSSSNSANNNVSSNSLHRGVIFDKIPEERREEYRQQLATLSEKVPRVRGNTSRVQLHTMRAKSIHDVQVDRLFNKIPEILCTYKESAKTTIPTTQSQVFVFNTMNIAYLHYFSPSPLLLLFETLATM